MPFGASPLRALKHKLVKGLFHGICLLEFNKKDVSLLTHKLPVIMTIQVIHNLRTIMYKVNGFWDYYLQ